MGRSWIAFCVGVLTLASPLRNLWARAELGPYGLYLLWAALIAVALAVARGKGRA